MAVSKNKGVFYHFWQELEFFTKFYVNMDDKKQVPINKDFELCSDSLKAQFFAKMNRK